MTELLDALNSEQRQAVLHTSGPLFVAAGPGSGKTRVITTRIAHRVADGRVRPDRLLAITFTNRAAHEMRSRVEALAGEELPLRIGTFHWACHGVLRRYGERADLPRSFRLLGPSEARAVAARVFSSVRAGERGRLTAAISALKNGAPADEAGRRHGLEPAMIISSRQAYDRQLRTVRSLDLDDLLVLTAQLLEDDPNVQERCRAAYDELLIDEYQDTNPVQQRLVELLTPHARTVMAVGDPDQAIYGWRLADSRAAERFLAAYPDAAVIRLETSYRSTKRILRAASTLIQHNSGRLAGEIRTENDAGEKPECFVADDEREEAGWISTEIERLLEQGVPAKDIAVLYRVNAQSRSIEDALIQRGITYRVVGGRRFYDRPEIQQAVCFLRVVGGPDEDAAALLARSEAGVGERRLERMREYARREGMPLLDTFERSIPGVPGSVSSRLASVAASAQALRARRSAQLLQLVDAALDLVSARAASGTGIEQEALEENLAEFRSLVVEMGPRTTLPDLLARVSLADAESGHSGVSLMTLHAAKGLEFGTVFITGVEEGLLPHRRSADRTVDLEEERRLCYVGMTRAKQRLYLSYAHARILGGRALVAEPSRFIKEIGSHNLRITLSAGRRAKSRLVAVEVGDRVMHPRWNVGVVTRVEGAGRETLVTVLFQSGERRIQLCHAPLTRLEGTKRDDLAG